MNNSLNSIKTDVFQAANSLGVKYSKSIIDEVFNSFGEKFVHHIVDFKTTTKPHPKRGFYFRYMEENDGLSAWKLASQSKLLVNQGRPVDRFIPEIHQIYPSWADGVDFEVNYGLSKVWLFPKGYLPLEDTFQLSSLPQSIKKYKSLFRKHHLDFVCLFAADYQHESMNLYFHVNSPEQRTTHYYKKLLTDLNCLIPDFQTLEILTNTIEIAMTFNWHSDQVERLCFYTPNLEDETVFSCVGSEMKKFIQTCPTAIENSNICLGWSFAPQKPASTYLKVDIDYNGKTSQLLLKTHSQEKLLVPV